jgi:hypothetical protein
MTTATITSAATRNPFEPYKLLCNHKFIANEVARLNALPGDPKKTERLLFIRVTKPGGGIEHRPMSRFDVLPENPDFCELTRGRKIDFRQLPVFQSEPSPAPAIQLVPAVQTIQSRSDEQVIENEPTTRFRKVKVSGKAKYLALAEGEAADEVYVKTGSGKGVRYAKV